MPHGLVACRTAALVAVLAVCGGAQSPLIAQTEQPDTIVTSARPVDRETTADLPVDRLADRFALEPGITSLNDGNIAIRGSGTGAVGLYLDGVPSTPGLRGLGTPLLGGSYFGAVGAGVGVGTNAIAGADLHTGVASTEWGDGRAGVISLSLRDAEAELSGSRWTGRAGWASDAIFGTANGLDFNRFTAEGLGRTGRFSVAGSAVLEGMKSERLGLEQNDSPVYVADGIDTTVTVIQGSTPTQVDVLRFKASPGIRIPSSAATTYTVSGLARYAIGRDTRFEISTAISQDQHRLFDYPNIYNGPQLAASRSWSRIVTGSWFGTVANSGATRLGLEAHLSWQTDRSVRGPLDPQTEIDTRDPFAGLMIKSLRFRFDFTNFPVNQELVDNFRTNTGRRSPYDVDNASQHELRDFYRNNAYGLNGFSDAGGPEGPLQLARENRLVGKVVADITLSGLHHVRTGVEATGYDVSFYSSQLVSQAFNEAYVESPSLYALFANYHAALGSLTIEGGLRYDHFATGASRPSFPRISTMPGFDPADPAAAFIKDKGHGRLSPRIGVTADLSPGFTAWARAGANAQVPDFTAVFAGINTDLSTTQFSQLYGTDLDFERATLFEAGARYRIASRTTLDGVLYRREDKDLVRVVLSSEFDPFKQAPVDIRRYRNAGSASATGLELRVSQSLGDRGRGWLSYSYVDATIPVPTFSAGGLDSTDAPRSDSRPHTLAGALSYQTGDESRFAGGVFRNTGVYTTIRLASGTSYTACSDPTATSDAGGCGPFLNLGDERLPALKLVDLRVTRGFNLGGIQLVAFADARNLLNTRNLIRVFAADGKTTSPQERANVNRSDRFEFAFEAAGNGVLLPDSTIDLSFAGAQDPRAACDAWVNTGGQQATPNCVYLIGAEERFGDGDHLFTTAEQNRASDALYFVSRGLQTFTGPGRRVRLGVELRF